MSQTVLSRLQLAVFAAAEVEGVDRLVVYAEDSEGNTSIWQGAGARVEDLVYLQDWINHRIEDELSDIRQRVLDLEGGLCR